MLVNISPTVASGHETYCSLKFASQVNQVQLGTAKKNITITTRSITAPTPAPVPSSSAAAPPQSNPHHSSPPPTRARPLLTHQNSFLTSSASASPVITTTFVPSQAIHPGNGTRSQLVIAPAARITSVPGPVVDSAVVSQLKQAPVSLQSMRAKRPGGPPQNLSTSSTAVVTGPSSGGHSNLVTTQASKRMKAVKSGTWR